ncbi:MAG: serine/threonine-protein kinase [Corynebacterium sp.]|uniref:serine/threonine-protein kinase n=1 Tax=Corynebacterium sp. TaxID=1720 RepID=UPI0026DB1F96|nr:serine/threonine-protein kinase [Corynebacterium sp.]MDO5030268.1 serine/threonine-protein kinase [Corynebacterium sp.]
MDATEVQRIVGRRYQVRRLLGRGGMSTVWLADDTSSGKLVAIKLLNQEYSDNPEFRQRFRNEASAARSVSSPNVVQIVTYQESAEGNHGACYIVMEYIRGESLSQVLQRRRTLPEHLVLDVLEQTAHGLSAIHAANLVHRDIKPGNLLVTPEGTVKITDFGIAKAAEAVPLTRTGMVVGTAQYVSPEQAQGRQVTPATDIYSLGCVAYEMVAGSRPFQGDSTVAVAVAHINEPPPALAPTVNPHIRELIGIMLRKDPQRRYADGRELAQAVLRVRAGHRPPQPRGVTPTVHRQSNAANPATTELGAMTRPPSPAPMPAAATAGRPAPTRAAQPAPAQSRKPAKQSGGCGCGCASFVLATLLVLLAGAIAVVYFLSTTGSMPNFSDLQQYIPNRSQEQTTEDTTDSNQDGTGGGDGSSWSGDNSGSDNSGWGSGGNRGNGGNDGGYSDGNGGGSTGQAPEPSQDNGSDNGDYGTGGNGDNGTGTGDGNGGDGGGSTGGNDSSTGGNGGLPGIDIGGGFGNDQGSGSGNSLGEQNAQ